MARTGTTQEPERLSRLLDAVGRALIAGGLLLLAFTAYQLWGTGIEQARSQALLQERGCVLHLTPSGWIATPGGELPPCIAGHEPMQEAGLGSGDLQVLHNLPPELRFTSNGLVLDGGTVVLASQGTRLRRCLVMALPLGVVRVGRYRGALQGPPDSAACLPDESL
mgnify:CR=1 FL=1